MLLREYRRSDFESMWRLDQECFAPGVAYSRSALRAFLSRKAAETIVAERDERIVAFVLGWRRSRTEGHVERLEYRKAAHLPDYYGPRVHAWKMAKALRLP